MRNVYKFPVIGLGCVLALAGCDGESAIASNLPDLTIKEVNLIEGEGTTGLGYREFWANVKIVNRGGDLNSDEVYLNAGDDQINAKVTNDGESLVLKKGQSVDFSYQILKDEARSSNFMMIIDSGANREAKDNGGNVKEQNEKNNSYNLNIL